MHPRPTLAVSSSPAAADEAPSRVASAPQVKPKIMRRPAQFSSPTRHAATPHLADTRIDASQIPQASPASPVLRPWHDDARFAIALLAIVILVNLALSFWLAPISAISGAIATAPNPNRDAKARPFSAPTQHPSDALLFHLGEAGARVNEQ